MVMTGGPGGGQEEVQDSVGTVNGDSKCREEPGELMEHQGPVWDSALSFLSLLTCLDFGQKGFSPRSVFQSVKRDQGVESGIVTVRAGLCTALPRST